ncbi:MAG: hypothetical protein LBL13_14275 [Bacteroidales bacterium]|jgi:hypothetical protein|nr:hypothetical protein [Bacteroidales bacterium]
MKKIIKFLTCMSCTALLFGACSKDEPNPFDGTDNHITSFIIKKDGVNYVAAIAEDKITITVPVNISLSGATVDYKLCENTTIQPDPATVSDWENEQVFRVKSYSGASRDYTYSVVRSEISYTGNVSLLTQADVETFAASGSTIVDGNLIIGSEAKPDAATAIVNLDGLSSIKEVKYHIIINSSFVGADLNGLKNVEKCGGIYIGTAAAKIALSKKISVELPALTTAGDVILNSDSVQIVSLAKLQSVSNFQLSSRTVESVDLSLLKEVAGNLSLTNASITANNTLTNISFPQLTSIGGSLAMQYFSGLASAIFAKLTYIGGGIDVTLNSNALEELNFPELAVTNGIINIERAPGLLTLSLPKVKSITSFIYNKTSYSNYPLANLNLSSLETIENEFYIRSIPMETLNFPKLKSIGGTMTIWEVPVTTLNLAELTKAGKLYLYGIRLLESLNLSKITELGVIELSGCLKLTAVTSPKTIGDVTINYASNATCPTPIFNGLETVSGAWTTQSSGNTTLFDIANVKHIGTFKISDASQGAVLNLPAVETMNALEINSYKLGILTAPELTTVENLRLNTVWSLATLTIPKLKTVSNFTLNEIGGSYNANNARMSNLDAFSSITSLGSVKIEYCTKLIDFTGLSNALSGLTAANWSVTNCGYNPTFQDMLDGNYVKP